jgi:hypothetical protein
MAVLSASGDSLRRWIIAGNSGRKTRWAMFVSDRDISRDVDHRRADARVNDA